MKNITKINEDIFRITLSYKDIFTTVYTIKTPKGVMLFDAASFDYDVENGIVPLLDAACVSPETVKYVFISHNHRDHAGALPELMKRYPHITIVSRCPVLKDEFSDYTVISPDEGDVFLDELVTVCIPGHTKDSAGIYDKRTKTLLCGDSLQLFGIFGSGKWASNISFPKEHVAAIEKLKSMDIEHVLTAHDYHPYGYRYDGKENIIKALDACIEPLETVKKLIAGNPQCNDEEIANLYNNPSLPTLGAHVVGAIRKVL